MEQRLKREREVDVAEVAEMPFVFVCGGDLPSAELPEPRCRSITPLIAAAAQRHLSLLHTRTALSCASALADSLSLCLSLLRLSRCSLSLSLRLPLTATQQPPLMPHRQPLLLPQLLPPSASNLLHHPSLSLSRS